MIESPKTAKLYERGVLSFRWLPLPMSHLCFAQATVPIWLLFKPKAPLQMTMVVPSSLGPTGNEPLRGGSQRKTLQTARVAPQYTKLCIELALCKALLTTLSARPAAASPCRFDEVRRA